MLQFAQTLDGRIAATGGDARWISGVEERRLTHALRSACDGVLVGAPPELAFYRDTDGDGKADIAVFRGGRITLNQPGQGHILDHPRT